MQRFWDKVEKTDTCWNWTAGLRSLKTGYGAFRYKKKIIDAHRMSWFLLYGYFPKILVCHHCDNKKCVNPKHLYEGTAKDNVRDMWLRGGRIATPHGNKNKYGYGCRCNLCREAQMNHQREYRNKNRKELNRKRRETNRLRRIEGKSPI